MPTTKIECENCYFCTYRKPYKCQFELTIQVVPKHNFCGKFLDRDTGRNIKELLTCANNEVVASQPKHEVDTLSEDKKKKLKELLKSKIDNKPI